MRVILVGAPGATAGSHWSHAFVQQLAAELSARGCVVECLPVRATHAHPLAPHAVAAGMRDHSIERALTATLRVQPADALVHVGVGARGSPNLLWVADRMGSTTFAVARGAEVVCQRGDLVHSTGAPCTKFDDAKRCCECCAVSWWRRPRTDDLRDRWDLLVAGLNVASAVFVGQESDVDRLAEAGVSRRLLHVARDVRPVADRVLAGTA